MVILQDNQQTAETQYIPEYVKIVGASYSKTSNMLLIKGYNAVEARFYKSEFDRLVNMYTANRIQHAGIIFTDNVETYVVRVWNEAEYEWYLSINKLLGCDPDNLICYSSRGNEFIYIFDELIPTKPVRKEDFKITIIDGIIYFNDIYVHYIPGIKPAFRVIHVVEDAQNQRFFEMGGTFDATFYTAVPTYLTEFTKLNTISLMLNLMSLLG